MSLIYSGAATATVASNTTSIAITGLDLGTVLPGMTISLGARGRLTGDSYIIAIVTHPARPAAPHGADPVGTAFNSAGFVIDTRDFNGTAPKLPDRQLHPGAQRPVTPHQPAHQPLHGSRQVALDKDSAGAVSRLLYAIGGRVWGSVEQRTITYTPTGVASVTTETLAVRAYPDGTTPTDVLTVDLGTGGRRPAQDQRVHGGGGHRRPRLGAGRQGGAGRCGDDRIIRGRPAPRAPGTCGRRRRDAHPQRDEPGAARQGEHRIMAAGDCFHVTSDASGNWRVRSYDRASARHWRPSLRPTSATPPLRGALVITGTAAAGAAALGLGATAAVTFGSLSVASVTAQAFSIDAKAYFAKVGSNYFINYADILTHLMMSPAAFTA